MVRIELWRDIEGFDGKYQVSNQGRVRSRQKGEWRLLQQGHGEGRYAQVVLSINGKRYTRRVHRLVAEAFVQNPNHLPQIDHRDGNCLNNYADNLRYTRPIDNARNPNTIGHLRGSRSEQRKQREARRMTQRLERMRTNDRCIIGDGYSVFFDRNNNYYILSYQQQTIDLNGETYIVDRVDDLPSLFHTRDYLNEDGTIDYAGLWDDMQTELNGGIEGDEDYFITTNEDGDEVIEWLEE